MILKNNLVNIIVVGFGPQLKELEKKCIKSIIENTDYPYMLTYIDNFNNKYGSLTRVWNTMIEHSICDYVLLNNNDTEVYPKWLSRMMEVMLSDDKMAFVGPATDNCHSPQKNYTYELSESCVGKKDEFVNMQKKHLSGFCLCMRKHVWEEIGGFDERFSLYGQESKIQDAAYALGYKSVFVRSAFVHHVGESSVQASGINVKAERDRAKKLYWSERKKG